MSKKLVYLMVILGVVWTVCPAFGQAPKSAPGAGNILVERWIGGGVDASLPNLKNNAAYPNNPVASFWYQAYDQPDIASLDYWGERFRGYLWPPQSGDYTFWIASDDDSEFWLSTDDKPANIALVCSVTGWTDYQVYDGTVGSPGSNQKSKLVKLQAGKRYYTEAMFSDGTGGGHLSVAWQGPGITARIAIAGKYLSPIIRDPEPMFMAQSPNPADGATGVLSPLLQWKKGATGTFHNLYIGTSPDDLQSLGMQFWEGYFNPDPAGWIPGQTYYWRVDEVESNMTTIRTGNVWSFTAAPLAAFAPTPRNGDKWIDPNSDLSWQPGSGAAEHDVWFGTDKDLVAARDASVFQGKLLLTLLELPKLTMDTTYYWLVDEWDSGGIKHEGSVWSFSTTTPTGGAKGEYFNNTSANFVGGPAVTRIDPTIDFNWGDPGSPAPSIGVDNFSVRWTADLEIAVADTYTFIGNSDDGIRIWLNDDQIINTWIGRSAADSFSQPQKLQPGIYSLVVEYYEATGGASCQVSWQTPTVARQVIPAGPLQPPVRAKPINPQNGDVNVPQDITLMWSTGEKVVTHAIYFGDSADAVAAATTPNASQAKENNTWSPGALEWNKTYYWRVDEVNAAATDSPWKGGVWSFTTANFLVVDDFESYTDSDVGRIFQTWIDGWGYTTPEPGNPGNGTGATVGYIDPPFAEHTVIHGGGSSMPLGYNNADSPNYSETERTFDSPQNWTVNGVNTLSLQVHGYPQPTSTAVTETGGKMSLTGAGADIWGASDQFTYAYKSLNGDGTIVAKVTSIGPGTNTWAKGGMMIRDSLDGDSASAQMVLSANTDGAAGNGAAFQNRATAGLDMGANDATSNTTATSVIAPPYWVKIERIGDTFTGYVSADGSSWTMLGTADVVMSAPVYIGICVTSHQAGENRTFQFEGIKTTGSVTGAWQGAVIDSPKYNSAQNLYVALQDSTGKIGVATDATAVNSADWVEVKMPLSSFAPVNASKIKKIFIGVGNRNAPVADGTGMLFIDDIRVIKP
jgi:hypothetical protein